MHHTLGRQEISRLSFSTRPKGFIGWSARLRSEDGTSLSRRSTIRCSTCALAIDAGTSRHTAAVFFQVRHSPGSDRKRVTVFGDYHALDVVSQKNARAIRALANQLPCRGRIDMVRLDPAASARSSLGPAAYSEYEREFGSRFTARWPQHLVLDGLDTIENLLETGDLKIHPRCKRLKDAFLNYQSATTRRSVDRFSGRWPSGRRLDGRASRRHSRCDAAGPGAGAEGPSGPCAGGSCNEQQPSQCGA